jgi:hypothetical protein
MKQLLMPQTNDEKVSIWQLIARKLADEATESELALLHKLLAEEPELTAAVQALNTIWQKQQLNNSEDKTTSLLIHQIRKRCISLEN